MPKRVAASFPPESPRLFFMLSSARKCSHDVEVREPQVLFCISLSARWQAIPGSFGRIGENSAKFQFAKTISPRRILLALWRVQQSTHYHCGSGNRRAHGAARPDLSLGMRCRYFAILGTGADCATTVCSMCGVEYLPQMEFQRILTISPNILIPSTIGLIFERSSCAQATGTSTIFNPNFLARKSSSTSNPHRSMC